MGPPGGGRQPMTNRMLRQMHMLSFADMPNEVIEGIFTTIVTAFIEQAFADSAERITERIVGEFLERVAVLRMLPHVAEHTRLEPATE